MFELTVTYLNNVPMNKKRCIYIIARQHAAETAGSLVMSNLIKALSTQHERFETLLQNYVLKIVPMINCDGVMMGNTRASLVGVDLNRRWAEPSFFLHPEIYFIKEQMKDRVSMGEGISIFCDLHGHNKKENCFFYGCNRAADEGMLSWTKTRLLPKILASIDEIFDFSGCRFHQDKNKLNTARVVIWNELKVTNSFTMETSQYGKNKYSGQTKEAVPTVQGHLTDMPKKEIKNTSIPFEPADFQMLGKNLLFALQKYGELEREVEKEWLKPKKMLELAGEARRDVAQREERESRFERTRNRRADFQGASRRENSTRDVTQGITVKPSIRRLQSGVNMLSGLGNLGKFGKTMPSAKLTTKLVGGDSIGKLDIGNIREVDSVSGDSSNRSKNSDLGGSLMSMDFQ